MKLNTNKILLSGAILSALAITSTAQAADLTASDATPVIYFNDTDVAGTEWVLDGWSQAYRLWDVTNAHYAFSFARNVLNKNAFISNTSGDINLADGSVFIDRSADNVGIGNTNPQADLHIDGSTTASIRLEGSSNWFDITGGNDDFSIYHNSNRVITIEDDGCDGQTAKPCIGYFEEGNPTAAVHYKRNDGIMKMHLEETGSTSGGTANRTMLRMENNGGPNMSFQDTSNGIGWQFAQTTAGDFAVSKEFSGGSEFILQGSGRVRMGPGPVTNFDLRANGDLYIPNGNIRVAGTTLNVPDYVFAEDYKLMTLDQLQTFVAEKKHLPNVPSEAEVKAGKYLDLGGTAMTHLEKIEELTLYTLQQHEQIKALQSTTETLTTKLTTENEALKERLASLEKLVTNIASSGNSLSTTGEKVALNLK